LGLQYKYSLQFTSLRFITRSKNLQHQLTDTAHRLQTFKPTNYFIY